MENIIDYWALASVICCWLARARPPPAFYPLRNHSILFVFVTS
jgi:hypothetical protein